VTANRRAIRLVQVFTTVGSRTDARQLARAMIDRHLAACAQISEIESIYRWKGAVRREREWRVLFKTMARHCAALQTAITELHPYELPAIYAVPVTGTTAAWAAWVIEATSEAR
jgi:periplasmic divalent cation tolerance protein